MKNSVISLALIFVILSSLFLMSFVDQDKEDTFTVSLYYNYDSNYGVPVLSGRAQLFLDTYAGITYLDNTVNGYHEIISTQDTLGQILYNGTTYDVRFSSNQFQIYLPYTTNQTTRYTWVNYYIGYVSDPPPTGDFFQYVPVILVCLVGMALATSIIGRFTI